MTVATFIQPNYLTQSASAYKAALDAAIAVLQSIGGDFAPHAQSSPNMQIVIDAGRIFKPGGTMVSIAQQITGALAVPTVNPRIDRVVVDSENGIYSVLTGTEAVTPVSPTIPNGKLPVCQVSMTVGMTTIANSIITDERTTYGPLARLMRMPVEQVQSATTGFTREILLTDRGILFDCDCSNGPIDIILPDSAQAGNGFMIGVMKSDAVANSITLTPGITGETFNDGSATKQVSAQNGVVIITTDGLGQWYLAFDSSRTYDNVTLTGTTTLTGIQAIQSIAPNLTFIETGVTADNSRWDFAIDEEAWRLRAQTDDGSSSTNIIIVQRTGTTVDSITFGGPLVSSSTFSSTKAAETGYSRVTPNMCRVDVLPSETPLTRDTITLVTGPTGSNGLILRLMAGSVGAGSIADRYANTNVYSDSGGTTAIAGISARGHEQAASAGIVTCQVREEVHVKTDSSSRVWLKLDDDAGNAGIGGYMIVGYYD